MSQARIRKLLESRVATWAAARSSVLLVSWQNKAFDPPISGRYLEVFLLPATTTSADLAGAHRSYKGIFQVSIVSAPGVGSNESEGIADELAALFPLNLALTSAGFKVTVISPVTISPDIPSSDSHTLPVSFGYRADTIT